MFELQSAGSVSWKMQIRRFLLCGPQKKRTLSTNLCNISGIVVSYTVLNGEQAGGLGSEVKSVTGAP